MIIWFVFLRPLGLRLPLPGNPPPQHLSSLLLQLLRKRHIGNDIVTIVFQEPGALPFTPQGVRSHFQHVFIIVRAHNPCTDAVCYRWDPRPCPIDPVSGAGGGGDCGVISADLG